MIRIAVADAGRQGWVWSAAGLVALVVSVFTTWCLNFIATVAAAPDAVFAGMTMGRGGYVTLGSNLLVFSCLPGLVVLGIVLSSVTTHTALAQSLWRLGGASPAQMVVMTTVQAVIVCGGATVLGALVSLSFQQAVTDVLVGSGEGPGHGVPAVRSPWAVLGSVGVLAVLAVLAVVIPARRTALRSPTQVRSASEQATRPGIGCLIVVIVVFVMGVLPLFAILYGVHVAGDALRAAAVTLPLGQALVLMTALTAPWVLPGLIAGWTRIVGSRSWPVWQLARHLSVTRIAASAATIAPLTLGLGLLASYGMIQATLTNLAPTGAGPNMMEGVVILLPIAVISAAGSIAVVLMAARQHTEDIVTMRSAGATRANIAAVMVAEAVIVTVSAVLVALIPAALQYGLLAYALGIYGEPLTRIGLDPLPTLMLAGIALAGMLIALLTAARSASRQPLSELLADR